MVPQLRWPPRAVSVPTAVGGGAIHLLAPNSDEWTYEGTNTWLLGSGQSVIVVDPGTSDPSHLLAIQHAAAESGQSITAVLLTHDHEDHSDGARELAGIVNVPIIANSAHWADVRVDDGDVLDDFGLDAVVIHTPGHSDDSICVLLPHGVLVTGDTILGGHSSGIYGRFRDFLSSLERLLPLVAAPGSFALPGHGHVVVDPHETIKRLIAHRLRRADQVRDLAMRHPNATATELAAQMYPSTTLFHRPSAVQMVQAIATYLLEADPPLTSAAHNALGRLADTRDQLTTDKGVT